MHAAPCVSGVGSGCEGAGRDAVDSVHARDDAVHSFLDRCSLEQPGAEYTIISLLLL